jgi:hypothetical protein
MLMSLAEYAEIHGKSSDTLRRLAERGAFGTAYKIGRNWVVDGDEEYPVRKRTLKNCARHSIAARRTVVQFRGE